MGKISDEILMAYADGELSHEEATTLEAILSQDATLRMRLEPFVATRRKLADTFDPMLGEPIPQHLISAIARAPVPAGYAGPRVSSSTSGGLRRALEAFAATLFPGGLSLATAASVALMVSAGALGGWLAGRSGTPAEPGLIATTGPGLAATGALAAALESTPSAAPSATGNNSAAAAIVPINTFRTKDSGLCREYRINEAAGEAAYAGLACRTGEGTWRVAVHVETPKPVVADAQTGTPYGTATGLGVPAVDAIVDTMISGDVLGADEERALRENGWRRVEPPSR